MRNQTIEKDWDEYASSLQQENPHLDPPGYGGDALPSGSSSEQGGGSGSGNGFMQNLLSLAVANPVLKTPQERQAERNAEGITRNQSALAQAELERQARQARNNALRRNLEEAFAIQLRESLPTAPFANTARDSLNSLLTRLLDTSAIAEQNRRFGKKTTQFVVPIGNWYQQEKTGFIEWMINQTSNIPGFKLLGENPTLTTALGGKAYYRRDGSIFFTNETDGYNRIWEDSMRTFDYYKGVPRSVREHMGIIMQNGVLVLPDDMNTDYHSYIEEYYGYEFRNGKFFDVLENNGKGVLKDFIATIHTHPENNPTDFGGPPSGGETGGGDLGYFSKRTPNKWALVMSSGPKRILYGLYSTYPEPKSKWKWQIINFSKDIPGMAIDVDMVLSGYKLKNVLPFIKLGF